MFFPSSLVNFQNEKVHHAQGIQMTFVILNRMPSLKLNVKMYFLSMGWLQKMNEKALHKV